MLFALALTLCATSPTSDTVRVALRDGDPIPGGGVIAVIETWSVNRRGQTLAIVVPQNNVDRIILDDQLLLRRSDTIEPGVTFLRGSSVSLHRDGHWAAAVDTNVGSALLLNGDIQAIGGLPLTTVALPGVPAGTIVDGGFMVTAWMGDLLVTTVPTLEPGAAAPVTKRLTYRLDAVTEQLVLESGASVGDVVTSNGERLVRPYDVFLDPNGGKSENAQIEDAGGALSNAMIVDGEVVLREGDLFPGTSMPIFLDPWATAFAVSGQWAAFVYFTQPTNGLGRAIVKNGDVIWQRGDLAPDGSGFPTSTDSLSMGMGPNGGAVYAIDYDDPVNGNVWFLMRDDEVLYSSATDSLPNGEQLEGRAFFARGTQSNADSEIFAVRVRNNNNQQVLLLVELEPGSVTGCQAAPNSTGVVGSIEGSGSAYLDQAGLTLTAHDLPTQSFGVLLAARNEGFVPMVGGGMGALCLGSSIGRLLPPNPNSGATGSIEVPLTLSALPQPMGTIGATAGESWYFQVWHRDSAAGVATSNLTQSYRVVVK